MPDIGAADSRALLWRVERALGGRPLGTISDEATVRQLEALWSDPTWADDPGLMVCASNLATIRANRREWQLQERLIVEARALFNSRAEAWGDLADRHRTETADEMFQGLTMDLIEILRRRGDWDQLRIVAADLLRRFPGTPFRQALFEAMDEAMRLGR